MQTDHLRRWIGAGEVFAVASLVVGLLASGAAAVPITLEGLSEFTYTGDSSSANASRHPGHSPSVQDSSAS